VSEPVTPELLLESDFAVTRELVRCADCGDRSSLEDARRAANLPTTNVLWEDTQHNIKRPIICKDCGNAEYFVREVIRVRRELEYVHVEGSQAIVQDSGGAPELLEEIRVWYKCEKAECEGSIHLQPGDFVLSPGV